MASNIIGEGNDLDLMGVKESKKYLKAHYLLHSAAREGNLVMLNKFIAAATAEDVSTPFNVDRLDGKGKTPLMYALENGHVQCMYSLIDANADVTLRSTSKHKSCLMLACISGSLEIVEYLLDEHKTHMLPLECKKDIEQKTELMYGVQGGNVDIVKLLLKHNATVNAKQKHDKTSFILAAEGNHTDIMDVLVKSGKCDMDAIDDTGFTALFWAVNRNSLDAIRYLLSKGADPRIRTKEGRTPLIIAAANGDGKAVESLVEDILQRKNESNIDEINLQDSFGNSALMWAAMNNHAGIVEYLIRVGHANCLLKDADKHNAADLAKQNGNMAIAEAITVYTKKRRDEDCVIS